METHTFAIIGAAGEVLATTNLQDWVVRMAPVFDGTPCRWLCGGWVPMA